MISPSPQTTPQEEGRSPSSQVEGLVVLNPAAGNGDARELKSRIRSMLGEDRCHLLELNEDNSFCEELEAAIEEHRYHWVAAAGGDGTVSLVGNCAAKLGLPLAIIPAGTGNALAGVLGIPEDIEAACQLLTRDRKSMRHVDGIRLDGQYYFLRVGVGLESKTMQQTSPAAKDSLGEIAYLWTALQTSLTWEPHRFTLTIDGQNTDVQAFELILANAPDVGVLGLQWGKAIEPDDGQLDIVAVHAGSPLEYLQAIKALQQDDQDETERITIYRASEVVRLEGDAQLPVHGDGELLDTGWPLVAEIVPEALSIIVPAGEKPHPKR